MNTRQLEARSDVERQEVENTMGEIRRRLTPGQLIDELLAYTKDGGGEFISNLGRQATDNPLPVSLIGAGLAWFLFSKGGTSTPASPSTKAYSAEASATGSSYAAYASTNPSSALEAGRDALNSVRDHLSDTSEKVSGALAGAKSELSAASQSVKDRVAEGASSVQDSVRSAKLSATTAANGAVNFLKDQPLVLLGAGFALGAAIGAGIPTTETEGRLMGEASENIKKQAKDAVSDQLDQAKVVGENLYEDIKNEVREGVSGLTNMQAH